MRSLLFAVVLLGCSGESFGVTPADGAVADTSVTTDTSSSPPSDTAIKPDTAVADTARSDTSTKPDALGVCTSSGECRKFSSYCESAACVCLPLAPGAPEPKCEGSMVTCFVDPCEGKTAECVAGACVIK